MFATRVTGVDKASTIRLQFALNGTELIPTLTTVDTHRIMSGSNLGRAKPGVPFSA